MAGPGDTARPRNGLLAALTGPVGGIAPWIVMSILAGPGRFEIGVGVALAMAVGVSLLGRFLGDSIKLLEVATVVFFTALAIVGLLVSKATLADLDDLIGEIANVGLVLITFGSIVVRQPFTIQYAREQVPRELWTEPRFIRTNYVITFVWAMAFLVAAIAGAYGYFVLDDADNLWTGWVIQIGVLIAAIQFTSWYPEVVQARGAAAAGHADQVPPAPPLSGLLLGLVVLLIPAGILGLSLDGCPTPVGVALIVVGALAMRLLHRQEAAQASRVEA